MLLFNAIHVCPLERRAKNVRNGMDEEEIIAREGSVVTCADDQHPERTRATGNPHGNGAEELFWWERMATIHHRGFTLECRCGESASVGGETALTGDRGDQSVTGSHDQSSVLGDLADEGRLYFHRLGNEADGLLEELRAVHAGQGALAECGDNGMAARRVVRPALHAEVGYDVAIAVVSREGVGSGPKNVRHARLCLGISVDVADDDRSVSAVNRGATADSAIQRPSAL